MHATTTSATALRNSQGPTSSTMRTRWIAGPIAVGLALVAVMFTGAPAQAEGLVPSASTGGSGCSTAADPSPSGSGWYVIVGDDGDAYSPEAEAFPLELAALWGVASSENEAAPFGWYVITDESGRAFSPEAEAFSPELACIP